jgi:Zn-dependent M32 family carboxypeptidase
MLQPSTSGIILMHRHYRLGKREEAMTEGNANRGMQAPQGAQEWLSQMQQLAEQIQKQQQMVQESMNTYMQMFNIPHSYLQEGMRLAQEDTPGSPEGKAWDESRHSRDFEGRFAQGEEWDESEHRRDAGGRFT